MSIQISKSPVVSSGDDLRVEEVSTPKSVNFGLGMEMFMNDRRSRPNSSASKGRKAMDDIHLDDLDELETGFNALDSSSKTNTHKNSPPPMKINVDDDVASIGASSFTELDAGNQQSQPTQSSQQNSEGADSGSGKKGFMSLFGLGSSNKKTTVQKDDTGYQGSSLGRSTANVTEDTIPTFKDIPIHPDMDKQTMSKPKRSQEETLREKFKYLRKLEDLENRGIKLSKHYSMESDLDEMMGEYEMILAERERQNSIKFQGKMLMMAVTGLEFLNNRVNPFDLQLDGWAESINENITDYDEVFSQLHEKYSGKANVAPELKLLFMLGGSAVMLHMTNTMFKSAMPGMDDIMRQNPELMQQFTKAAVSSMGQQNPGFGDFMGNMMGGQQPSSQSRPQDSMRTPRPTRPDSPPSRREYPKESALPKYDRPPEDTPYSRVMENRKEQRTAPREEMKGPSDISDLLSRLKPKGGLGDMPAMSRPQPQTQQPSQPTRTPRNTSMSESQPRTQSQSGMRMQRTQGINPFADTRQTQQPRKEEQRSTISIQELKELQTDMEKSSRRRGKSERNTISLDI